MSETVTNKQIYEATLGHEVVHGALGVRAIRRFRDTLRYVRSDVESVLDVGCHTGEWLHHLIRFKPMRSHLGVDVAANRVGEAKRRFPELNVQVGFAESLSLPAGSFDLVTCMEVLEHISEWLTVFNSLFRFASKQVLVTVPYRQQIIYTACIHCAKMTPLYGHLRSYTEESFPEVPGWRLSFARIRDRDPDRSLAAKVYFALWPRYSHLLANYQRI